MRVVALGLFTNGAAVKRAVDDLEKNGYNAVNLAALFPKSPWIQDLGLKKRQKSQEQVKQPGMGAMLRLLTLSREQLAELIQAEMAENSPIDHRTFNDVQESTIPGLGTPLISCGPILREVESEGIAGALVRFGLPGLEAALYEERIKAGNLLIIVFCDNLERTHMAKNILQNAGGENVSWGGVEDNS